MVAVAFTGIEYTDGRGGCGPGWSRAAPAPNGSGGLQEHSIVARIAGVNIPTNKRVVISLRYIYGIGPEERQVEICDKLAHPGTSAGSTR